MLSQVEVGGAQSFDACRSSEAIRNISTHNCSYGMPEAAADMGTSE
ncbi:MAG: hypothetical protein RI962_1383 [Pseudomonadota bacterium]